MKIGTRILYPEEAGLRNADILQISVYNGMKDNLGIMKDCAIACRDAGIRYVVHPVGYSLLQEETLKDIMEMAEHTDAALILHDERTPEGKRIEGKHGTVFTNYLEKIKSVATVSFENAVNTEDVQWFWDRYADSITLDVGHVESSGLNSIEFVKSLDKASVGKIQFVHMHRDNGLHGNITDHWPLNYNCREVRALEELLKIKPDVSVILEINEVEEIDESMEILRALRDRLGI